MRIGLVFYHSGLSESAMPATGGRYSIMPQIRHNAEIPVFGRIFCNIMLLAGRQTSHLHYAHKLDEKIKKIETRTWAKAIENSFQKNPEVCPGCLKYMIKDTVYL